MSKLVIISGATATGKSDLAVEIAEEIGAEIISADSILPDNTRRGAGSAVSLIVDMQQLP
jgi:predicted kinase